MSPDDDILAASSYNIVPQDPQLVIYEKHPIYGLLSNRAISGEYKLSRDEATFAALPFFFGIENLSQESLSTIWRSNAREVGQGPEITLRRPEGTSGTASVAVKMVDSAILSWPLEKSFLIQFGE
jgi:hypothetical protein